MLEKIRSNTYNTQADICIAEYSNGRYPFDCYYTAEDLFLSKNGEYYLFGRGGAMSKYAVSMGDNYYMEGREIIPLTVEEAKEWAKEYADLATYNEIFANEGKDQRG